MYKKGDMVIYKGDRIKELKDEVGTVTSENNDWQSSTLIVDFPNPDDPKGIVRVKVKDHEIERAREEHNRNGMMDKTVQDLSIYEAVNLNATIKENQKLKEAENKARKTKRINDSLIVIICVLLFVIGYLATH